MINENIKPLRCVVSDDEIQILISAERLSFAAAHHLNFWDGESGIDVPTIKVTDIIAFAKAVSSALNDEAEDGSTPLTRMLDEAIVIAVESGCDGIDHA